MKRQFTKGTRYGKLTIISPTNKRSGGNIIYKCICDCGKECYVSSGNLGKSTNSCGCLVEVNKIKHNKSRTKLYDVWTNMKQRCNNPKNPRYKNYGGRGIAVCDEWRDSFSAFANWAMANGYEEGLTIERIDVDDGYKPSNCTWITKSEQVQNRRMNYKIEYNGEVKNLAQWCEEFGIRYGLAHNRIHKLGWDFEKAMTTPCDIKKRNKRGD